MLIIPRSPLGGRKTERKYPLDQDKKGNFGIRLGYLEDGDKVILRMSDAEHFVGSFSYTSKSFWKKIRFWG